MDEQRRETISRISTIILMVSILVVAGAISAITAMRLAIRGKEVSVPVLSGKTEEEARQLLEDENLQLKISGKRFSPKVPEGKIIEQDPPPGSRLKTERSVKVLLSNGDRKYPVPDLNGTSLRAAQLTLLQRNFTLGSTSMSHMTKGDASTIQSQSPPPGSQEGADPEVNVLISLGPPEQYFVMPDLVGKPAEPAAAKVRAEGFRLGKSTLRKYAGVGPGIVMQQKPQAGYRISKNDAILLEVSQ